MIAQDLTHNLGGVWRNGRGSAPCPCCQPERRRDQTALSVTESGGRLLLHCFKSSCDFRDIAAAANVPASATRVDPVAQREADQKRAEYEAQMLKQARGIMAGRAASTTAERTNRSFAASAPMAAWCQPCCEAATPTNRFIMLIIVILRKLKAICESPNGTHRKCRGWRTQTEVFRDEMMKLKSGRRRNDA